MSKSSHLIIYHKIYLEHHPEILEISDGYCIHHKDFNHYNNDPNNLQLMTKSEHQRLHALNHKLGKGDHSGKNNPMYGRAPWSKGKTLDEKIKQKMKDNHADFTKEKHPRWVEPTFEMVQDIKNNNISQNRFIKKYKSSNKMWNKIRKNLLFYDLKTNNVIQGN